MANSISLGYSTSYVKGYVTKNLSKRRFEKSHLFNELKEKDEKLAKRINDTIENHGLVFSIKYKGKLAGVYIFRNRSKKEKGGIELSTAKYLLDVDENIKKEIEKDIIEILKDAIAMQELQKVKWDDKVLMLDGEAKDEFSYGMFTTWVCLGVLYSCCTGNFVGGISMGILFGIIFATSGEANIKIEDANQTKRNKEKQIAK